MSSEQVNEPKESKGEEAAAKASAKALRPWYAKKRFIVPAVIILLAGANSAINPGDSNNAGESVTTSETQAEPTAEEPEASEPAAEEPEAAEPTVDETAEAVSETMGQSNARQSAERYLDFSAFSKKGLIEQLKFEDYSQADAEYAVEVLDVDWKEQAVKKAKSYLDFSSFSRQGLIDQLVFEGFSKEEAEYGASQNGY